MVAKGGKVQAQLILDTTQFTGPWKKAMAEIDKGINTNKLSKGFEKTANDVSSSANKMANDTRAALDKIGLDTNATVTKTNSLLNNIGANISFQNISTKFEAAMNRVQATAAATAKNVKSSFDKMGDIESLMATIGGGYGASQLFQYGQLKATSQTMLGNMGKQDFYDPYLKFTMKSSTSDQDINRMFQYISTAPGLQSNQVYKALNVVDAAAMNADPIQKYRDQMAWASYMQGGWGQAGMMLRDEGLTEQQKASLQSANTPEERIAAVQAIAAAKGKMDEFGNSISTTTTGPMANYNATLTALDTLMRGASDGFNTLLNTLAPIITGFNNLSPGLQSAIGQILFFGGTLVAGAGALKLLGTITPNFITDKIGKMLGSSSTAKMDVKAGLVNVNGKSTNTPTGIGGTGGKGGGLAGLGALGIASIAAITIGTVTALEIANWNAHQNLEDPGYNLGNVGNTPDPIKGRLLDAKNLLVNQGDTDPLSKGAMPWLGIDTALQNTSLTGGVLQGLDQLTSDPLGFFSRLNPTAGTGLQPAVATGSGGNKGIMNDIFGPKGLLDVSTLKMPDVGSLFTPISDGATNAWNTIKKGWDQTVGKIISKGQQIYTRLMRIWNLVKTTAKRAWNMIKSVWNSTVGSIISRASSMYATVRSYWNQIYSAAKSVIDRIISAWNNLVAIVSRPVNAIINYVLGRGPGSPGTGIGGGGGSAFGPRPSYLNYASGSSFKYEGYGGHQKSISDTIGCMSGNCVDGTLAQLALANSFGIPAEMVESTWGNSPHVYAKIGGQTRDLANRAITGSWDAPPRGPSDSSAGDTYNIPVTIQGDVYGVHDLDKKIQNGVSTALTKKTRKFKRGRG